MLKVPSGTFLFFARAQAQRCARPGFGNEVTRLTNAAKLSGAIAAACLAGLLCATARGAERVMLEDFSRPGRWAKYAQQVAQGPDGSPCALWTVEPGRTRFFYISWAGRGIEAAEYDLLLFDYRILDEGCTWFGAKLVDWPVAGGMQAVWAAKNPAPGGWRTMVCPLAQPHQIWGEKPDKKAQWMCVRASAARPVRVLIDNVRLAKRVLRVAGEEREEQRTVGGVCCRWAVTVENVSERPQAVALRAEQTSAQARLSIEPRAALLAPGEKREFSVRLCVGSAEAPVQPLAGAVARVVVEAPRAAEKSQGAVEVNAIVPLPDRPHPRLWWTAEDFQRMRALAQREEWARKQLEQIVASAESAVKRDVVLPDRGGQWYHWYVCRKCGSRLRAKSPTEHVCPKCGTVHTGEPYDSVYISTEHSRWAGRALDCALAFQLTGKRKYAEKAAEILLAYADVYLTDRYKRHDPYGRNTRWGGRVMAQTLTEAVWLLSIAPAYDCVAESGVLSAEQRRRIEKDLIAAAAQVIRDNRLGVHNIQCWHNSAMGCAAIVIGDAELLRYALYGPSGMARQLAEGVQSDGTWWEGSWGYHFYTMRALWHLAEAARRAGIDMYTEQYRAMFDAPLLMAQPNLRLPAFNDSREVELASARGLYELAYARWHDRRYAALLEKVGRDWRMAFLHGAPKLEVGNLPELKSKNFAAMGIAVLRVPAPTGEPTVVYMDYGPHGGGHGHPDKLNIVVYARGRLLVPDPGTVSYGSPLHRGWYKQTISHNTLVVDEKSQAACAGKIEAFGFGKAWAGAMAAVSEAYPGVLMRRALVVRPSYVLDVFRVQSEGEHTFDLAYHVYGKMESPLRFAPLSGALSQATGYKLIEKPARADARGAWQATWRAGDVGAQLTGLGEAPTTVFCGLGRALDPTEKIPMLLLRRRGKSAEYVTLLEHFSNEPRGYELQVAGRSGEALCLRVRGPQGADLVLINPAGKRVSFPEIGLEGDARIAVVLGAEDGKGEVGVAGAGVARFRGREVSGE